VYAKSGVAAVAVAATDAEEAQHLNNQTHLWNNPPCYIGTKGCDRTSLRGGEGEAIGGAFQQRVMRKMHANICMNPEKATHVGIPWKPYLLQ
jgi:hypothetical protein